MPVAPRSTRSWRALADERALLVRTAVDRAGERATRYLVHGSTEAGRRLLVVVEPTGRQTARVITVRNMTDRERRRYEARGK